MATTRRKMILGSATCYAVLNEHEGGKYTIAVEVPGLPVRHDNDHSYDTEGQAMAAAEALASSLVIHLN